MKDITPRHVGFIIDGNRRWAKQRGIPTYEGHLAGYNALQDVVLETLNQGVEYVSIYIFSTENWKRSQDEVGKLMNLVLKLLTSDIKLLHDNNIRLLVVGSPDNVSDNILNAINDAEAKTAGNTGGTLALCFNYGGQLEIADAVKEIVRSGIPADDITPDVVAQNLYYPEVPPLDLLVRTSGEQRISNFMLWRVAYAEMLFLDKLWPDMTKEDVTAILKIYAERDRRIGG